MIQAALPLWLFSFLSVQVAVSSLSILIDKDDQEKDNTTVRSFLNLENYCHGLGEKEPCLRSILCEWNHGVCDNLGKVAERLNDALCWGLEKDDCIEDRRCHWYRNEICHGDEEFIQIAANITDGEVQFSIVISEIINIPEEGSRYAFIPNYCHHLTSNETICEETKYCLWRKRDSECKIDYYALEDANDDFCDEFGSSGEECIGHLNCNLNDNGCEGSEIIGLVPEDGTFRNSTN